MENIKIFEPGIIKLLFSLGHYDGMQTGVGEIDGKYVYLTTYGQYGHCGETEIKPKWRQLYDLVDELMPSISDLFESFTQRYCGENEIYEDFERTFEVREMSDRDIKNIKERQRRWELHVGVHTNFSYNEVGKPVKYRENRNDYWKNSKEYVQEHYYNTQKRYDWLEDDTVLLGTITYSNLFCSESEFRVSEPKDPRSEELKAYQKSWKPGDPVKLDW